MQNHQRPQLRKFEQNTIFIPYIHYIQCNSTRLPAHSLPTRVVLTDLRVPAFKLLSPTKGSKRWKNSIQQTFLWSYFKIAQKSIWLFFFLNTKVLTISLIFFLWHKTNNCYSKHDKPVNVKNVVNPQFISKYDISFVEVINLFAQFVWGEQKQDHTNILQQNKP